MLQPMINKNEKRVCNKYCKNDSKNSRNHLQDNFYLLGQNTSSLNAWVSHQKQLSVASMGLTEHWDHIKTSNNALILLSTTRQMNDLNP